MEKPHLDAMALIGIPADLFEEAGIRIGDGLEFYTDGDKIVIRKLEEDEPCPECQCSRCCRGCCP